MQKKKQNKSKKKSKTVLIFGISSFVGSNLAEFIKKDYKVIGTYYRNRVSIPGVLTLPCDVLNKDEVQLVIFAFKPDVAIYTVGLPSIVDCADSEELADALNTGGLINVTEHCQRYKTQVCYISSAFVFGGAERDYIEMDIPDANTIYGKTVAASEFYVQKNSLDYLIFRTCKLYGRGCNALSSNWFEFMQRMFSLGKEYGHDDRVHMGLLDIYYLGMLIKISLDKSISNRLFQVSTKDCMTMNKFANTYAETFGEPKSLISKGRLMFPEIKSSATDNRPEGAGLYYKMDVSNIESLLSIKLPTIKESIDFTFQRFSGKQSKESKGDWIKYI